MFAPLCLQVGDVIAKAYRDGVFAAGRFAELRPQIAVHYSGGGLHEANMTVAVVCWLRERGHEIAGGWAKEIQQIADALAMEQTKANSGRPRRRRQTKSILPLTKRQNEVVAMVAQCNGNIAEAARRLGRTPKTVREAYAAARGKLRAAGVALSKSGKAKTHRLLEDHRGQIFLAGQDDGPAHIGPRPDVPRDLRRG
jgi:DNA-binding CsgD family transcriptional regulator